MFLLATHARTRASTLSRVAYAPLRPQTQAAAARVALGPLRHPVCTPCFAAPEGDRASTPCPGIEARDVEGHWSYAPTLEVRS